MGFSCGFFGLSFKYRAIFFYGVFLTLLLWFTMSKWLDITVQSIPKSLRLAEEVDTQQYLRVDNVKSKEVPQCPPLSQITDSGQRQCPMLSPYLIGTQKLTFESSLTLEDVERKNPKVVKGRCRPEECTPIQRVAILIPFRNREKHLLYLLQYLHPFLQRQLLEYGIYIINQAGTGLFNRAKLLNIGYMEALKDYSWDCFIFHDVDLIPENDFNLYLCDNEPKHLVVGRNSTGYRLRYRGYFGGATALTRDQFSLVNGFSNKYWGWGGEDDDLMTRVRLQNMRVVRPSLDIARYTMVFHKRDSGNEVNPNRMKTLARTEHLWKKDGLNSCTYELLKTEFSPLYINITVNIGSPEHPLT
ncbi:beta-1,4-galactosyltransferase 4 [Protopterus annectens]|uniref:beta-1,4-galactosyltransferase 4 n=1 Tax=Protopterus annectens TaxID=7888 RepID=UPI001CFC0581|nr:beta-1,4-galactosyltransferase 4 [Protopterus annectens]XP_043929043.1 beta-1,4-galactosyltransferase 4 [Protopterus annectens]XP_043929044.1 beta-1,4-galactosyltransferase 4 [Protopterus annectens]